MSNIIGYTNIPTNGLVASYNLDGDALDTSGEGNDGSATDVTFVDAERGYVKEAGSFNGSSSYIKPSNDIPINDSSFTLSFTFKVTDTSVVNALFSRGQVFTGGDLYGLALNINDKITLSRGIGDGTGSNVKLEHDITLNTNIYYNLSVTYNKNNGVVLCYLDNKLIDSSTFSTNNINYNSDYDNGIKEIGRNDEKSDTEHYFNGNIGLVRIYNRALSESEIQALYQEGLKKFGPQNISSYPELFQGCVGYWDFRGGNLSNLITGENATNNGATLTTDHLGNSNGAYSSDGDQYVEVESYPFSKKMTVETYIYNDGDGDSNGYMGNWYGTNRHWSLNFESDGKIGLSISKDGTWDNRAHWDTDNDFLQDTWYHIVTIFDNGTVSFYINGIEESNSIGKSDGSYDSIYTGGDNITRIFRGYLGDDDGQISGDISFVKIFNRVLSATEVSNLYNLTKDKYIYPNKKYSLPNLEDGLVFELGSNGKDISGNQNHGTLKGDTFEMKRGQSVGYSFDGDGDYISNIALSNYNNFTINATYKRILTDGGNEWQCIYSNDGLETWIGVNEDDNTFRAHIGGDKITTNNSIGDVDNNLIFVSVVYLGGNNAKLYVNGLEVQSTINGTLDTPNGNNAELGRYYGGGNELNGQIYSIKIWNRALSPLEIQQLYYSEKGNFIN